MTSASEVHRLSSAALRLSEKIAYPGGEEDKSRHYQVHYNWAANLLKHLLMVKLVI